MIDTIRKRVRVSSARRDSAPSIRESYSIWRKAEVFGFSLPLEPTDTRGGLMSATRGHDLLVPDSDLV